MKYLREIAVCALIVIAAATVYKIVHKHYHHKHHEVTIQGSGKTTSHRVSNSNNAGYIPVAGDWTGKSR